MGSEVCVFESISNTHLSCSLNWCVDQTGVPEWIPWALSWCVDQRGVPEWLPWQKLGDPTPLIN